MSLGQRIRETRLEAGLSQRQLCGDTITRNMLSQIEHGTVQPSMHTLRFLAERLGKPVSFFLDEETITSPNTAAVMTARKCYGAEDYSGALEALEGFRFPDAVYEQEVYLLTAKCCLALAAKAVEEKRFPYGEALLNRAAEAGKQSIYYGPELERQRLLLLAQVSDGQVMLPNDDRALLIRAKAALAAGNPERCAKLLDAVEEPSELWYYLRGETCFQERNYAQAAVCYQQAEVSYPMETAARLEHCFRELEDYKLAYYYACKLRDGK